MFDVIVIGGGLAGAATAYHLVRGGARTLLVDRHHPERATNAGAGILAPETSGLSLGPDWFDLALPAGRYYPLLAAALQREQEQDVGYGPASHLTVAVDEDEDVAFARAREVIFTRQRARGAPTADALHDMDSGSAQRLFPALAPTRGAVYFRDAARVDGRSFTRALMNAATGAGLEVRAGEVERLVMEGGRVSGMDLDGERLAAGRVVIAGGAWSQAFGEQLGRRIPVEPQRGQIIHLQFPESVDTDAWPIVTAFHGHYMLSWADHRVTIGATRETNSGFEARTTAAGVLEVLREGLRVAPGLAEGSIKEIRVGLRPSTADNLPVLGEVDGVPGLLLVTGHGASGLQLAPYSGKLIADLALGRPADLNLDAFRIERFATPAG